MVMFVTERMLTLRELNEETERLEAFFAER